MIRRADAYPQDDAYLQHGEGRVAFELPVLLPDEEFVGIELIRGRSPRGRNRCKG